MAKSQRDHLPRLLDNQWLEVEIKSERVSESTKEKYLANSRLLVNSKDIKRIASHPTDDAMSILQMDDGANFMVNATYPTLKASLVSIGQT